MKPPKGRLSKPNAAQVGYNVITMTDVLNMDDDLIPVYFCRGGMTKSTMRQRKSGMKRRTRISPEDMPSRLLEYKMVSINAH